MRRSERIEARISPRMKRSIDGIHPEDRSMAVRALLIIGLAASGHHVLPLYRGEIIAMIETIDHRSVQAALEALLRPGVGSTQDADGQSTASIQIADGEHPGKRTGERTGRTQRAVLNEKLPGADEGFCP